MNLYTGVVESRKDPLKLGRCQVRIVGLHTHDKTILPTEDLPWAYPMQPITSAAMNGIGVTPVGVVEGTWVVVMFRDEDMQQPIILGSIGGVPQQESNGISTFENDEISFDAPASKVEETPQGSVLVTSDGGTVNDGSGNPIKVGEDKVIAKVIQTSIASSVGSTAPPANAKPGIDALNKAMDDAGIKGKYGRAAILGIAGGECGWVPKPEGFSYSAAALKAVFPSVFKTDELANKYARWTGTRESFFEFLYGASSPIGQRLGNKKAGDGGAFYGRGFIQITGLPNYEKYGRLAGVDIVNNPDILNTDLANSAKVSVAYFKDRVKVSDNDPAYFQAALKAVGGAQSGWPKKEAYYNYFLGDAVPPPPQTDKTTAPDAHVQGVETSPTGLPADREKNISIGFSDPNMKYPLRSYIGEPDTNRLARGKIVGTAVELKDNKILKDVPLPNGKSWSQPDVPFGAKYPFNKVMETESGHIMEFDDTPDYERIHLYHRKGTYTEIDPNGTQVNRIVGDGYSILERNGFVVISGKCNVTVYGEANLLVQNDANIQVEGDTNLQMKGNANFGVAGDFNITVGGAFKVKSGSMFLESGGDINSKASGSNRVTASGTVELNAGGRLNAEGSTIHFAEGSAQAAASGLGNAPAKGTKSDANLEQLKPIPRNLEEEVAFETPEENQETAAVNYHADRKTETTSDQAEQKEEAEKPVNEVNPTKTDCDIIFGMASFPDSFVLHTDKTGYKWTLATLLRGNSIVAGTYSLGPGRGTKEMSRAEIVCNLKALAVNILGPINEMIGPVGKAWQITSCYRSGVPGGGSVTSQHLSGCAVDISPGGNYAYKLNYDWATKLAAALPYDQLLLEYRDPGVNGNKNPQRINWIHISYNNYGAPKRDLRTFLNDKTYAASKLVLLA